MDKYQDYIVRATAAEGKVRMFAATTKNLVEEARRIHNTSPVATAALGRTLTAAAMMGSMMKGREDVLTVMIDGGGPIGKITVTATAAAGVKGYVTNPAVMLPISEKGKLDVGGAVGTAGMVTVIKDLGMKEPYTGQTKLISGEIAEDMTCYFAISEQTPSAVALGVLMNRENTVRQAGGFIVQLMPDAGEELISYLEQKMTEVTEITSILDEGMTPEEIIQYVLEPYAPQILERTETKYFCNCSKERVQKAISAIGIRDLQEMVDAKEPIEVKCHFCDKAYYFDTEELSEMIQKQLRELP